MAGYFLARRAAALFSGLWQGQQATDLPNPLEAIVKQPAGKRPQVNRDITITLTDYDRRRVDQFCQIMRVGYSEFFRLLLSGAFELAKESNAQNTRPLEVVR